MLSFAYSFLPPPPSDLGDVVVKPAATRLASTNYLRWASRRMYV